MNERASIGSGSGGGGAGVSSLARLRALLHHVGRAEDPVLRDRVVQVWTGFQVAKWTGRRAQAGMKAGQPGPEMSIGKLALTQNLTELGQLVSELLGPRLTADTGEWGTFAWNELVLGAPGMRLAGGTDEVMRNIIGERVLGLPKEPPAPTLAPAGSSSPYGRRV
jgi:alkylation response protein AidB-like acyl-CoA dehydrogenase